MIFHRLQQSHQILQKNSIQYKMIQVFIQIQMIFQKKFYLISNNIISKFDSENSS